MFHLILASDFWHQFWHPLAEGHGSTCSATNHSGCGYSIWSGALADLALITIFFSLGAFLGAWYRKHNCHVHRCWRLQWHAHPDHGHPVCAVHHPSGHHGTWWRIFHSKPRPRDHFLSADMHKYDHAKAPSVHAVTDYAHMLGATSPTTVASGYLVVDEPPDEPPERKKRRRVRKPGTDDVTDIGTKKP